MSLNGETGRIVYAGDNSTTSFYFPYKTMSNLDIYVYTVVNSTGISTGKNLDTHYTISGTLTNNIYEDGCTITFLTAPLSTESVVILRDVPATQTLELTENGKIPSDNLEKELDKLAMTIAHQKKRIDGCVRMEVDNPEYDDVYPALPNLMVPSAIVGTNAAGDGFEYTAIQDVINTIDAGASLFTASRAIQSNGAGALSASATTSTELGYLSGVTSAIQTQFGNMQTDVNLKAPIASPTFTGTITTPVTASRAVISNGSSALAASATTSTELALLSGSLAHGSYTPVVSGSGTAGTLTYSTQVGGYARFGNIVFFWFNVITTGNSVAPVGNYQISLPATAATITSARWSVTIGFVNGLTLPASTYATGVITSAGTVLTLQSATVGGGSGTALAVDDTASVQGSGWYVVA